MPVCHKLHLCKEDLARALSQRRERIKEEAVKMVNGEERAKYFSPSPPRGNLECNPENKNLF